jgi:anti-sigma factor NepR-like protein
MTGTERNETGAGDRTPSADSATMDTAYGACMAADSGLEEKRSPMQTIKEMIAAPERAAASPTNDKDAAERSMPGALATELPGHLGAPLRAIYGALVNEPVPEKFFHLLKELEAKEQEGKS